MAFADVLDRWEAEGRHDENRDAKDFLSLLRNAEPHVHDNLDGDALVNDDKRDELLQHLLSNRPATEAATIDSVKNFCYQPANQLVGAPDTVAQSANLGHVKSRQAWQNYYESTHGSSALGFATRRGRSAAMTIEDLLSMTVDDQKILLAGRQLSRHNMFSFYQTTHPNAPYANVTTSYDELKRRLGLGFLDDANAEALYWSHGLQSTQTAHQATALDAADYRFYRPGGKTFPLDGAADGLPEVVHIQVAGDQLVDPIRST